MLEHESSGVIVCFDLGESLLKQTAVRQIGLGIGIEGELCLYTER